MKNIQIIMRHKILEITLWLMLIIVSFPLWELWREREITKVSLYNNSYAYVSVNSYQNYSLYPMKDEVAMKHLFPMKVEVKRDTIETSKYTLVFRINKKTSVDLDYLKFSVNDQIYFFRDRFWKEDQTYSYYLIDEHVLDEVTMVYYINIWLDSLYSGSFETIDYDIVNGDNLFLYETVL